MLPSRQRDGNQRAWTNVWIQGRNQLPEHRYHVSTPKYSSHSSAWHSQEGSSHTTPDRSQLHTRQRSDASHELEYDPSNDPIRGSIVDGMLQSLNDLPDASGPLPHLKPLQTSFPDGEFYPSADLRSGQRGRAPSSRGTSLSSNTPIAPAVRGPFASVPSPSTPKRPFFHARRHTSHNSRAQDDSVASKSNDARRRNLAKTRDKNERSNNSFFNEITRLPQSRMKQGETMSDMHAPRNNRAREDSPSSDFDLNPQDHQHRRRSRSYHQGSASVLNRARPVPGEYHVFDDDEVRRAEAQRVALRKSASQPHTPEYCGPLSAALAGQGLLPAPSAMPSSNHGSSKGSVGGGADSPFWRSPEAGSSIGDARVPHSQSFTSTSSSLRTQNEVTGGKAKERAGFLKRMFGSSKGSSSASDPKQHAPQLPPLQIKGDEAARRAQALQEHQPASAPVVLKPSTTGQSEAETSQHARPRPQQLRSKSSFFRRRRKTLTEQEIPQMPTQQDSSSARGAPPTHASNRPSTSSLKQVMNPYINDAPPPRQPDPDEFDLETLLEAPVRTPSQAQNAYEFLRSTSPGAAGQGAPGPALPRAAGQERRMSPSAVKPHRHRPSTSAANDPVRPAEAEAASGTTLRNSLMVSAETKAKRRRSATSPAARAPAEGTLSQLNTPTRPESSTVSDAESGHPQPARPPASAPLQALTDTAPEKEDSWLAAELPPQRESISRGSSSNRVWIQSRDSSEDDLSASINEGRLSGDPGAPSKSRDVASDTSVAQEDFISAKSVPEEPPDSHEDEVASPLPTPADITPSSPTSNALPSVYSDEERALRIFEAQSDPRTRARGALELGEAGEAAGRLRAAFMSHFDFAGLNILLALRDLCARMTLKGETQQMDRIMSAFSRRWCECNSSHGFKSEDVVHTICYSLLLLNTDLHVADLTDKMTRSQFVKNTIPTLRRVAEPDASSGDTTVRPKTDLRRGSNPFQTVRSKSPIESDMRLSADDRNTASRMSSKPSLRPTSEIPSLKSPGPYEMHPIDASELLVNVPHEGNMKSWEVALETVLKEYYLSIRQLKLPLHGAEDAALSEQPSANSLSVMSNLMRRTGSVISKAPSEDSRSRASTFRSAASRFASKNRSRPRLYPASTLGSSRTASRTSLEDIWSPSASSLNSQGKSLTTMSTDSLHTKLSPSELGYQQSIGFANALSHVIIREEGSSMPDDIDQSGGPLLDDDRLELAGAPWAKEGMLQHKHHLESEGKKARDRNWSECFAVIQRGNMRLFSFNSKASTRSQKSKPAKSGGVVGGGNWLENAESLASFTLLHTIANALPPPGYSKQRPHVFALSLPTGAVHLFHVGTTEIAQEFVMTANYWSARLSKEPLVGGVSNIEYGWGESVINTALAGPTASTDTDLIAANKSAGPGPPSSFHIPRADSSLSIPANDRSSSSGGRSLHSPTPSASFSLTGQTTQTTDRNNSTSGRPSISGSLRSSFDAPRPAVFRNRLPADRLILGSWQPPQQSLMPSRLPEPEQLAALKGYVASVEEELARHNELRPGVVLAFSPRSVNAGRALGNWERKSHYLLREIVKFRTYVDVLGLAEARRGEVKTEREDAEAKKARRGEVRKVQGEYKEDEEDMELSGETLEALRGMRGSKSGDDE